MVGEPLSGEEMARWQGFNLDDFAYFKVRTELRGEPNEQVERSLRAQVRSLHSRLRQLAAILEPPLPDLVLDISRPPLGRLPGRIWVAFHRPEAGRKQNDAHLFLSLSREGMQIGMGWGSNRYHSAVTQALATFYERIQHDPQALALLDQLQQQGFTLRHRQGPQTHMPADWLRLRPGIAVFTIPPEAVVQQSKNGSLPEEILQRLQQLRPLYRYIYPVPVPATQDARIVHEDGLEYDSSAGDQTGYDARVARELPGESPLPQSQSNPEAVSGPPTGTELYAPAPVELLGTLQLPNGIAEQLITFINLGRHVILAGPPGTGKTTFAINAARAAAACHYVTGYLATTATADWTTFDTVGGYTPGADGRLHFREGLILQALRENRWVIIDEINRADIDKAFGQVLTVLSGQDVELPFRDQFGRRYQIVASTARASRYIAATATYEVGRNWRILATMNTVDKNALFAMSYAFMRRFAFVQVASPSAAILQRWIDAAGLSPEDREGMAVLLNETPRPLGPAILQDMLSYLAARRDPTALGEAIIAYLLPQLEGVLPREIERLYFRLAPLLTAEQRLSLSEYLAAFFALDPIRFAEKQGDEE